MLIFLDTETTGVGEDDRLCQLAYKMETGKVVNELFKPSVPIPEDASAIHNITNEMVENKPTFMDSPEYHEIAELLSDEKNILIAHNADFDIEMLEKEEIYPEHAICTLKLVHYLDPDGIIPKHNLQFLRSYFKIEAEATAHDALGDIIVLEKLFKILFEKMEKDFDDEATIIEKMIEVSDNPILLKRMPFGKHKGKNFEDIPEDYLRWLSDTEDMDENVQYSAQYFLKK